LQEGEPTAEVVFENNTSGTEGEQPPATEGEQPVTEGETNNDTSGATGAETGVPANDTNGTTGGNGTDNTTTNTTGNDTGAGNTTGNGTDNTTTSNDTGVVVAPPGSGATQPASHAITRPTGMINCCDYYQRGSGYEFSVCDGIGAFIRWDLVNGTRDQFY